MSAALDRAAGDPYYSQSLPGDIGDYAQMAPYQSGVSAQAGQSWWEGVIQYGLVRAIDNATAPRTLAGNGQPGTFAGANGRTYAQAPNATGQTVLGASPGGGGWGTLLLLAGVGVAAFALLKR
ncbi:hypothetical protein C1M51_18395 [Methylibium sp. Pch-M]|uniref:hypothetical protein n=1 Tax=Methylibium sp. Pch-M TaxID=2082386 RepID=UPI00101016CC|nr:hypothetical protein [Methylibium sp. Pch-M]QAZ41230.1 hypothetical protein C1M51_18395 [Methylibium sp. Pch-M]